MRNTRSFQSFVHLLGLALVALTLGEAAAAQAPADPRAAPAKVLTVPEIVTDGADPSSPGDLTAGEREKLARAREAVEAARVSGDLDMVPPETERLLMPPATMDAMKLRLLSDTEPVSIGVDALAVCGVEIVPVQRIGGTELTPHELAKLNALLSATSDSTGTRTTTGEER